MFSLGKPESEKLRQGRALRDAYVKHISYLALVMLYSECSSTHCFQSLTIQSNMTIKHIQEKIQM